MAKPKGGLGKGLDVLFADTGLEESAVSSLKLSEIEPNPAQPRKTFDDEALGELATSIGEHGVLQPILVRPVANGMYRIVAGERRWRASRMAGLTEVPVVIREMDEIEAAKLALIENLQREDLSVFEEAEGYRSLMESFSYTQEQVAVAVGKSRPAVANALRLLSLPTEVRDMVKEKKLSPGHARAILSSQNEEDMIKLARDTVARGLTVRQVEKLASQKGEEKKSNTPKEEALPKDKWYREMQAAASAEFGRPVKIVETKKGGILELPFYSKEDLYTIMTKLAK